MADRLISAEKLKEAIQKNICEMSCDEPRGCSYCKASDVWDVIHEQPTVDAVPVVRCKDCKWYNPKGDDLYFLFDFWCDNDDGMWNPSPESYCSCGERREE